MHELVTKILVIIGISLGAICTSWLMLFIGGGFKQSMLGYEAWALAPYAVLMGMFLRSQSGPVDQLWHLSALASIGIGLGGPLLYFDAVFVNVDAQGALVLLMIPALQLFCIFMVMATIFVVRHFVRQRPPRIPGLTFGLVNILRLLVPAALGGYGLVICLQYADLPALDQAREVDYFIRNHLKTTGALPTSAQLLQRFPDANRQKGWFIHTDDKQYLTLQYPVRWWNSKAIGHAKISEFTAVGAD